MSSAACLQPQPLSLITPQSTQSTDVQIQKSNLQAVTVYLPLTRPNSISIHLSEIDPGDSLFVCNISRVTWDIIEDVTKVFFGQMAERF